MCVEASSISGAVATDFFSNCWYLEIPSDNRIRYELRCAHYHAQNFRLEALKDFNVGSESRILELYSVKYRFEVEVTLRPTVSRPVSLGIRPPPGIHDQFFFLLEIFFR
jgi:hypothetical protein